MMKIIEQYELAIAALLHDIGKFKQRAFRGDEKVLSIESRKMEEQILPKPQNNAYHTHRHSLWTYDFLYQDLKPLVDRNINLVKLNFEKIALSASKHHNPDAIDKDFSSLIAEADRISAANERLYKEEYERGKYLKTPLCSIFPTIKIDGENNDDKSNYAYKLQSLDKDGSMFPEKELELSDSDYKNLYDSYLKALKDIVPYMKNEEQFLRKLEDLAYEYMWCIPSATNDYFNDISLYDHSRTTMSIALALATAEGINNKKRLRICAVGVSGIQSFIFQSKYDSFKGAARIFRGRSLMVSVFTTALKIAICEKLNIIPFLDFLDAGGNITLILPNIDNIEKILDDFRKDIEEFLLTEYFGTLSLVIDYSIAIEPEDLKPTQDSEKNQGFQSLYSKIGKKLAISKNQKFKFALYNSDYVLEDSSDNEKKLCIACGKHGCKENDSYCEICESERLLGKKLPSAKYLILSKYNGFIKMLPGIYLSVDNDLFNYGKEAYVYQIGNDISTNEYPTWRINNYVHDCENFEEIAQSAVVDGTGKAFLAYIKVDVDSLGKIVFSGFDPKRFTISRFSTFSRSLHYFFNTYIHDLLESEFEYSYTVLSGGDDIFVIMPWDKAIYFVNKLKKEFSKFCGNNPELHFSAGIVLSHKSEPFAFVNSRANRALDIEAKEKDGKNAISYLGVCMSLNELDGFISDIYTLDSFIDKKQDGSKPLSMGFLYRLYGYIQDRLSDIEKSRGFKTYALLRYDIARNILDNNENNKDISQKTVNFILNKFDNYNTSGELEKFRAMVIHVIYENRKTDKPVNQED